MATIMIAIYLGAAIGIAANLLVRPSGSIDDRQEAHPSTSTTVASMCEAPSASRRIR